MLLAVACAACGTSSDAPNAESDPLGPVAASCGSLDSAAAVRIATANLERVLRRASRSLDFADHSALLPKLITGSTPKSPWDHASLDQSIDDLVAEARDSWFAPANVESQSGATVTYRLSAQAMCRAQDNASGSGAAAGSTPLDAGSAAESSCSKFYREHEIRLQARRVACDAGENLHVDLLNGPERTVVLGADWFENRLAHGLDVGAIERIAASLDSDVVLDRAEGRAVFQIATTSDGAASLELGFPQAIDVQVHSATTRSGLSIAKADGAIKVASDPVAHRLTASTSLGLLEQTMPLADFTRQLFDRESEAPPTDVVTVSISGFDGEFAYDAASDALKIQHLGLGGASSRVTHNGATLLKIDVNAAQARHLDVGVHTDAQGRLSFAVQPSFQLDIEYAMASVNPLIADLEQFALDDTVTIQLEGAQAITMLETKLGSANLLLGNRGFLLLSTGGLGMTSRFLPSANVQLVPGECLFRNSSPFVGQHELLRELASRPCP